MPAEQVQVNMGLRTVTIPHWGITLRRIHGAVVQAWENPRAGEVREFSVKLDGATVATIYVKAN